jgi:hypothetical protein
MRGVIIPCCGPPVATPQQPGDVEPITCCQGNILCPDRLTIDSTPNPSMANERVAISGHTLGGAAATVVLWQSPSAHRTFKRLTQTTADASGAYSFKRRVQTNRLWYVTAGALRSATISQQVQAVVKLTGKVRRGRVTLTGSVSPSHARERIQIERQSGSAWARLAQARLDRRSRFRLTLKAPAGRVVLRAMLAADSRNVLSASSPLTIR